jgi:hypothetical protein
VATIPILGTYPAERFATAGVQPASSLYVSAEDQLLVNCWNSVAGAVLILRWRIMRADGQIVTDSQNLVLTSARATNTQFFPVCEGFLLGVTVAVSGATPKRGQTFVQVGLARGTTSNPEQGALLISDYCTNLAFAGFPGGILRSPLEGPGVLRSITGTVPGAGAEISETVPTNARWAVRSFRYTLTASATVATRNSQLVFDDGTNILLRQQPATNQAAGQVDIYNNVPNHTPVGVGGNDFFAVSPTWPMLAAGSRIRTFTANIQAGDQYTAPPILSGRVD